MSETSINSSYEVFSSKLASTTSKNDNVSGEKRLIHVRRGVSVVEVIEGNGTEWNLFVCKGKHALKRSIISVYCNIFLRLTNMDNETK